MEFQGKTNKTRNSASPFKTLFIAALIFSWTMSGLSQVFAFPPDVRQTSENGAVLELQGEVTEPTPAINGNKPSADIKASDENAKRRAGESNNLSAKEKKPKILSAERVSKIRDDTEKIRGVINELKADSKAASTTPRTTPNLNGLLLVPPEKNASTTEARRKELKTQLAERIRARKEIMREAIINDPKTAITNAFPEDLRSQIPEDLQGMIEQKKKLKGKFEYLIVETFDDDDLTEDYSTDEYYLKDEKTEKRYQIYTSSGEVNARTGDDVSVDGIVLENQVAAADDSIQILLDQITPNQLLPVENNSGELVPDVLVTKKVAVILVNFTNNTSQPWTTSTVRSTIFTGSLSVDSYYQESSFGKWAIEGRDDANGDIYGWYTLDHVSTDCSYLSIQTKANAVAQAAGVSLVGYDNIIYAWPYTSACNFSGLAVLGGTVSYLNGGMSLRVISHELGHNYGMHHATSYTCTENGTRVSISTSTNCAASEYGDPFTVMGGASRYQHSSFHKEQSLTDWLETSNSTTTDYTQNTSTTFTLAPIETASSGIQTVRVPKDVSGGGSITSYYYLEYRQPYGFDNFGASDPAVNGITIRLAPEYSSMDKSKLIDTNPDTATFADAPLAVGQTFTDSAKGISITTLSTSTNGATVGVVANSQVASDSTSPTVGGSGIITTSSIGVAGFTLSWIKGTDNLSNQSTLEYRVYRSLSNNIDTVSNAETNGTALNDFTADIASYGVTGLTASTTYYFNIIVRDQAGNKTAYSMISQATLPLLVSTDSASSITATSTMLNGTLDIGGQASSSVFFRWRQSGVGDYTTTTPQQLTSSSTFSQSVSGFTADITYEYKAVASWGSNEQEGSLVQFTTLANPTNITVSGAIYSDEGVTVITTNPTVRIKVNGAGDYSTTTTNSGVYSIPVSAAMGDSITVFLDEASENAATITRAADGTNITGLDLYQNKVIVRHEDSGPIINADLNDYDNGCESGTGDSDILFCADAYDTVTVDTGIELIVRSGSMYAPGARLSVSKLQVDGTLNSSYDISVTQGETSGSGTITISFGEPGEYLKNIAQISSKDSHTCVVSSGGNASYCWGTGSSGQLGNGLTTNQTSPARVLKGDATSTDHDGTYLTNISQISVGGTHVCAVSNAGNAYCWGLASSGQLGNGTTTSQTSPARVLKGAATSTDNDGTYFTNISQISADASHTCAVSTAGNAYCWGSDGSGQVGNGATTGNQTSPVRVLKGAAAAGDNDTTNLTNISQISSGSSHTCAVSIAGNAYCWGSASSGRLGDGQSSSNQTSPARVLMGAAAAADTDETNLINISQIFAGSSHTCAVSSSTGNVYCWGSPSSGQLGNGLTTPDQSSPVRVLKGEAVSGDNDGTNLTNIVQISNCAVSAGGNAYCWGGATNGRLGNGQSSSAQSSPIRVLKGAIVTWTSDNVSLVNISQISAGSSHTCAISNIKSVYCWGLASSGQLGNGLTTPDQSSPVRVLKGSATSTDHDGTNFANAIQISSGTNYTCAASTPGNSYCWGSNSSGQLGNGTTTDQTSPVRVLKGAATSTDNDGTYFTNISQISAGGTHACAVSTAGNAYCWGSNTFGQLGNGTTTSQTSPVRVLKGAATSTDNDGTYFTNISQISAGNNYTCAVASSGNAYCWGIGTTGQLGNGTTTLSPSSPVRILAGAAAAGDNDGTNLTNISQIVSGSSHTCTVSAVGNAYCWGNEGSGRLGNGTTTRTQSSPVRVLKGEAANGDNDGTNLANVSQISLGISTTGPHTCASASTGNVYCWGSSSSGQLGNGVSTQTSPVRVLKGTAFSGDNDSTNLTNIPQISAGNAYTCAVSNLGNAYCWGSAGSGTLGNGIPLVNASAPVSPNTYLHKSVFHISGSGNFGGSGNWTFYNLTFGDGSTAATTTSSGSGSITVNGKMYVNSSHMVNAGSKNYIMNGSGEPFVIRGTWSGGTGTVTASVSATSTFVNQATTTFNNFTSSDAGKTIQFTKGKTYGFTGTLTLSGNASSSLGIESTASGTQWLANFSSAQADTISYVLLKDSGCATGTANATISNSTNVSNNGSCWAFGGPVISNTTSTPTSTAATITWTTDTEASSQISYGVSSSSLGSTVGALRVGAFGHLTTETDTNPRVTSHQVNIYNLIPCTKFYFKVISKDSLERETTESSSFRTTGCSANANPQVDTEGAVYQSEGGAVSLLESGKGVIVTVPSGFASRDAIFQIKRLAKASVLGTLGVPTGKQAIGDRLYGLTALADGENAISSFDGAITITLSYDAADVVGMDESTLRIYRHDGSSWGLLSGCSVDTSAKTVSCSTTAFSEFSIFGDTTPPSVMMTSPSNSAVVSGIITLYASSTDGVAVQGVQFQIDGSNLGSQVTSTSTTDVYGREWDTRDYSNGSRTIRAIATDTSGNITTSTAVSITISNASVTASTPAGGGGGMSVAGNSQSQNQNASSTGQISTQQNLNSSSNQSPQSNNSSAIQPNSYQPLDIPKFIFKKYLIMGSTGLEVTNLQQKLKGEGFFAGPVTGYFGKLTQQAVRSYQEKYEIASKTDPGFGVVGPKTRSMLNAAESQQALTPIISAQIQVMIDILRKKVMELARQLAELLKNR